jgi:hypothetical protein
MRYPILLLAWSCLIASAQQNFFPERIGVIGVNREPATWTSPEGLVQDLRSEDAAVRSKAQQLQSVRGEPDAANEVGLEYFSQGAAGKPVVGVRTNYFSFEYAAVAVPSSGGWKRLAVFECWCKYDNWPGLVNIGYSPDAPGLKLGSLFPVVTVHGVAGGTGEYEQTEALFAIRDESLVNILSFAKRKYSNPAGAPHTNERRWFDGRQLMEDKETSTDTRTIKTTTCTPYKWDAVNFKYTPSGPAHPCKYEPPK